MAHDKKRQQPTEDRKARERAANDDATHPSERQLDDNQDDLGRDANDPDRITNEINKTGH